MSYGKGALSFGRTKCRQLPWELHQTLWASDRYPKLPRAAADGKHPVFSPKMAVGVVTPGAPPPIPRRWVRVGPSAPPRLQPDVFSRRDTPLRRAPCPGSQALSRHLPRLPGRPPLPARGRRVVPGPASLSQIKFSRGEI